MPLLGQGLIFLFVIILQISTPCNFLRYLRNTNRGSCLPLRLYVQQLGFALDQSVFEQSPLSSVCDTLTLSSYNNHRLSKKCAVEYHMQQNCLLKPFLWQWQLEVFIWHSIVQHKNIFLLRKMCGIVELELKRAGLSKKDNATQPRE